MVRKSALVLALVASVAQEGLLRERHEKSP